MRKPSSEPGHGPAGSADRRSFVSLSSTAAMAAGLVAGYGMFVHIAGRFLYPARARRREWLFVARAADLGPGSSLSFRTPDGTRVAVARRGKTGDVSDFVALSSTCPHLGCQVHWQAHNSRFFCPCHNGVFDPAGRAVSGPPADAGQSLARFPLKIENGLLFIEVPVDEGRTVGALRHVEEPTGPTGPGHDPCLRPDPPPEKA